MFRSTALLSFCLLAQRVLGQQVGTLTAETHPTVSTCLRPDTFDVVLTCLFFSLASSLRVLCRRILHELQLAHRLGRQLEVDSLHHWLHQRTTTCVHCKSFSLLTTDVFFSVTLVTNGTPPSGEIYFAKHSTSEPILNDFTSPYLAPTALPALPTVRSTVLTTPARTVSPRAAMP